MKKLLIRLSILIAVGAVAWGGYTALKKIPQARESQIPFAKVRQGDVVVRTYARGELRAVRSAPLYAPNLFGTVQVTKIAPLGSFAREKDLVVEFDDSEVLSRVEEKQLEIDQIDEQTKKAEADLAIRNNQDEVELLRTRYSVRRAELEVKRNPLLGEIDQKRNLLNLQEAERRLKQLESDIKSRREQAQAELGVLRERKNKALLEMRRERMRLNQVKLLSPMSGLVAIRQNRGGGFFVSGMSVPDIREGDQVQPGVPVADILDLSEMEVIARIGELDRANLKEGQEVFLTLDALADKRLKGQIKSMSGTASANIFSNDPAKKFDVLFSVDMRELLTHLGAKPDQIARVLAQAETNRKKPVAVASQSPMMAFGGGMPGGAPGGMVMMGPGGGAPAGGGEGGGPRMGFNRGGEGRGEGRGGGGFGGNSNMTPEQQQKMREIFQKVTAGQNMREMTPEDRQKMMQKVQDELKKAGIDAPAGMGRGGRGGRGGEGGEAGAQSGERAGRGGRGGEGGEGGGRGGRGGRGGDAGFPMPGMGGAQQFSEQDLANAKLPPPPEDDNQLEVLLRPGLLADVEIIVERIPNAIHIPAQAVFDKGDGRSTVFVKEGNRFVARVIKPLKRSESTMVIADGLKAGEDVALADPDAKPSAGKKGESKDSGGSPMIPSGKGGQ